MLLAYVTARVPLLAFCLSFSFVLAVKGVAIHLWGGVQETLKVQAKRSC